ncbi:hypothetical protein PAXRUDRAFT_142236 [Paxillus rubicundulus Ve08.2h10]|uniref:Uncharacterized protein n=1 Tax=Paxillus rubicundulus Ve08.2h10 TaxID=930991 RepID=A0A0D0E895_9AGAM|nr:hypothetical protein PAXRUDRAFT_142236 [Paxillus rubicundulus Ve08.2h10]
MSMSDREYSVLLNHLHRPSSTILPLPTLQGLIVHYLSQLAPTPTPLAATIVSSSLFRPFSLAKLEALSASFRHAVHAKLRTLQEEPSGIFSPSLNARLNSWSTSLLGGLEGGHAITRLACCSGLLLGLEDILAKLPAKHGGLKASVEDEMILAFAEVIDLFFSSDSWGKEFQPVMEKGEDALTLPLIISSHALLLVPPEKFIALPLPQMLSLVARTITEAFASGTFMSTFPSFLDFKPEYKICVKAGAPIHEEINAIASSHAMTYMGSLSKLCSRIISLFVDYRPKLALPRMQETFLGLEAIAKNVEAGWLSTGLADAEEESIAPETRPLTTSLWTILKTLLFCIIMITEAGLSATVYAPSALGHSTAALALIELRTLSYLAFVIEKFGGVGHSAFSEFKRAFYLALDVLGSTQEESEHFVKGMCEEIWSSGHVSTHHVQRAKKAFALSAIEQLVPVLSTSTIQTFVLPFCSPHLAGAAHRETFESAHSVVLAILSSRSKIAVDNARSNDRADTLGSDSALTEKMVPFYAQCLIENSADGKLSVAQLRLAFVTLVKHATLTCDPALAWLCIDSILAACRAFSAPQDVDQRHRLHLSLISSLPSLPLMLLSRALSAVKDIIDATPSTDDKRKELVEAVFQEILENMGDAEKEHAVCWWNEQRVKWMASWRKPEDARHTQIEGFQAVLRL